MVGGWGSRGCGGGSRRGARRRALPGARPRPRRASRGARRRRFWKGISFRSRVRSRRPRGRGGFASRRPRRRLRRRFRSRAGHVPPRIEHAQAQGQGLADALRARAGAPPASQGLERGEGPEAVGKIAHFPVALQEPRFRPEARTRPRAPARREVERVERVERVRRRRPTRRIDRDGAEKSRPRRRGHAQPPRRALLRRGVLHARREVVPVRRDGRGDTRAEIAGR